MAYRQSEPAPEGLVPAERRGRRLGTYCRACTSFYPLHHAVHSGKPLYGKDHISSPCQHEGEAFEAGADWWEPAIEVKAEVKPEVPVAS